MNDLDFEISRQRADIDLKLLHLTQERIADDLLRALEQLPHWSGSIGQPFIDKPAPAENPGMANRSGAISSEWRDGVAEEIERRLGL